MMAMEGNGHVAIVVIDALLLLPLFHCFAFAFDFALLLLFQLLLYGKHSTGHKQRSHQ